MCCIGRGSDFQKYGGLTFWHQTLSHYRMNQLNARKVRKVHASQYLKYTRHIHTLYLVKECRHSSPATFSSYLKMTRFIFIKGRVNLFFGGGGGEE